LSGAPLPFYANRLLFGRAGVPGQLAFAPGDATVRVYSREGDTEASEVSFRPFILLADPDQLKDFKGDLSVTPLDGPGVYRWLAEFPSWFQCLKARDHCREVSGRMSGAPEAPYQFFPDPVHQFLLRTGRTSFLGMTFGDLRRMAVDIEVTTAPGFEFPNAARESDRIIAIAMADSTGFQTVLSGAEMSEADLLRECGRIIRERDPDAGLVGIATYKCGKTSFDSNIGYYAIDVSRADFDNDRWFVGEAVRHELNKEWTVVAEAYGLLPNTRAGGYATWYFSGGPQWSVRENVVLTALLGSAAGHKSPDLTGTFEITFSF
jgi:hypothetical protein